MKVAILGHGIEGKSAEEYFKKHNAEVTVFDPFNGTTDEVAQLGSFDLVMRSPSIPPHADKDWSSITKYFLKHCPCPIIGVTGTKGKGTTCSLIASLLEKLGHKIWLVGNIGKPALDILDDVHPDDVVVYEMSSFQLWDVEQSPHFAVVLRLEPDHLNVHVDYDDYVNAKSHITAFQTSDDVCVYYRDNVDSCKIAELSQGHKLSYPIRGNRSQIEIALKNLSIVGAHNGENAEAALTVVAAFENKSLDELLQSDPQKIAQGLHDFYGLPHRMQFVRKFNNVSYYDDSFATNTASLSVALKSFPGTPSILILGGQDKTNNADLPEIVQILQNTKELKHTILIGESGHALAQNFDLPDSTLAESLADAVVIAKQHAEKYANTKADSVVLFSPTAASFDMFESAYVRGDEFQKLVKDL